MMKVFSISATGSPFDGRAGNAPCAPYVRYAMVPKAQGRKPTFRQRGQLKRFLTRTCTARPRNHHHRAVRLGALPHGDERRNPLEIFSISATGSPFDGRAGNAPCAPYVRYAMVPKAQGRKPTFRQRGQLKRVLTRTCTARPRNHHHRAVRLGALPPGDERRNPLEMRFIRDERCSNQAHLLPHGRGRRAAHRRARTGDGVDIERRGDIGAEQGARFLEYGKGQVVEPTSALLAD